LIVRVNNVRVNARKGLKIALLTDECMSSGTYTEPLNYATSFNVPLLIHIVVCSTALTTKNY